LSSYRVKIIRRKSLGSDLSKLVMQALIRRAKGIVGFRQAIDLCRKKLDGALKAVGAEALVVDYWLLRRLWHSISKICFCHWFLTHFARAGAPHLRGW